MGIGGIVILSTAIMAAGNFTFALAIIAFFCVKITPQASVERLEKLLKLISTLPAETLHPEASNPVSEDAADDAE
ncbi:MAG: hypothetical protein ACLR1V_10175 [Coprococcus sp.]